uniref:AB hydrolase-1 domain-containing protein n=1 Tax=Athene cunicularia TaxID=194338 RepID=A0A663LQI2_ATHCN
MRGFPCRGWLAWRPWLRTLLVHLLLIYISVPFLIRLFPVLLTKFVFLNFLAFPFFVDLRRPELLLNNTVSLYLATEPGVTVGIWHTVPGSRGAEAQGKDQRWYEEALADAHPVIIYLHGNGGTRGASHRVQFLKTMGAADFHILALDYRGYGDSSGHPTESGFTTDVLALYDWAKARSGNSSILFWGHSLGTGIATNAARKLQEERGKGRPSIPGFSFGPLTPKRPLNDSSVAREGQRSWCRVWSTGLLGSGWGNWGGSVWRRGG